MIVLGIDPGLRHTGFGLIKISSINKEILDFGTISPSPEETLSNRLFTIYEDMITVIDKYNPSVIAIEEVFYGKNVKSALLLGHARGVPMLLSAIYKLPLYEFSPRRIKQSLTGNGNSTKEQVQFMVKKILLMDELPQPIDASDALAIAVCYNQNFRI